MKWLAQLFSRRRRYDDLSVSIREHLDEKIDELMDGGMSREEAAFAAQREFGNVALIEERGREAWQWPALESVLADVRFALRQLRKSPGFAVTAVLTLALGIGATAAMFSVIDAVVLRPLPYKDSDRIAAVKTNALSGYWQPASWMGYAEMRKLNQTFASFAGYEDYWGMTLKSGSQTRYLNVDQGTDNFFDVFGVRPLLGRTFASGEDQPGKNNVVVLSYEVWRESFASDPSVIGKNVSLDGEPYSVIGVMPAGFRFPYGKSNLVYIPMHVRPSWIGDWRTHWLQTIGRLKPGVSMQRASADMTRVMQRIGQEKPDSDHGRTATLIPITTFQRGSDELPEISLMLGAVLAVLLIACANVAGLLLARGVAREKEMAMRVAIGAAKNRLVRQLLVENMVLGMLGAGAGIVLAAALLAAMKAFLIHAFMRGDNIHLDLRVIAVTLCIGMLSSIAAGLAPAWRASRTDPNHALKSGVSTGASRRQHRLRAGFVVAQIALSLVLLVFSGLLLTTLRRMLQTGMGFNPENLLTFGVNIPSGEYRGHDYVKEFVMPFEERVRAIPGVTAAGWNDQGPLLGYGSGTSMRLVGQPPDAPDRERNSETRTLTPGYYEALGIPILRGRNFGTRDTPTSQRVAIVNEAWVKEFLTNKQDPLAQAFQQNDGNNIAIVGVAGDVRQNASEPARPEIDFPLSKFDIHAQQDAGSLSLNFYVRTTVPPLSIVPQLREMLHSLAPSIAFQRPETMEDVLSDALVSNRMESWVFGIFALIAVLLVAVGIYGLLMQEVTSQVRSIGIRMALGATRSAIAQEMLTRIAALLAIGFGSGLAIALFLRHAAASMAVMRTGHDGVVIAALIAILAAIGFLAAIVPARRAASIDPMQALRSE